MELFLAQPRGFCAGVRRAIALVEEALATHGAPVYVRHEIVHNKHVISDLERKGAVFVNELAEVDPARPVIFSAHGVSFAVVSEAERMKLNIIDATCPLVAKVHQQVNKLSAENKKIVIIGKANHPEIIGTMGQVADPSRVWIVNSVAEVNDLPLSAGDKVGFVTQTTLSVFDTAAIVAALKQKFPNLEGLKKDDICFATSNRQKAVVALAEECQAVIIIGSKNSSNSKQLKETAVKNGAGKAFLIDDVSELDWNGLDGVDKVGISAGASAPEYLVENLLVEFKRRYAKIKVNELVITRESVNFKP